MITYNKKTPVLLLVWGSNEIILNIYNQLQKIEPERLYLVYNDPAVDAYASSRDRIQSVFKNISWKCKLKTLYNKKDSDHNTVIWKAVRWFFRQEPEGIVLDGISVPFPALFAFCSHLLEKYRNEERIGHISGSDFLITNRKSKTNDSYYFSKLVRVSPIWASWRRVWKSMDAELKTFRSFKKLNVIEDIPTHQSIRYMWHYFNYLGTNWDARCEYINLINNRLTIVPNFRELNVTSITSREYELTEMNHPIFMVTPFREELRLQEIKYQIPAVTSNESDGFMFLLDKLESFKQKVGNQMKIPRIIHQIYEDPAGPPANLLQIAETWKEKMPDWEYRFWNKPMIQEFLEMTCPDFIPYYNAYPFNVQRWDAVRYLILYHIGGLYVDFDYECISPLDVLLFDSTCCMGMEPAIHSLINHKSIIVGNALMASKSGHPYMAAIIEDMKTNFSVNYGKGDSSQVLESTGPFMVTRVYEQYKKKKDVTLLPADLISPLSIREVWMLRTGHARPNVVEKVEKAFAIHYFMGSWMPRQETENEVL